MAKQGLSYYQAETDRFQDIKIKRLKMKSTATTVASSAPQTISSSISPSTGQLTKNR